ncbi:hypothetical protein ACE38W_13950 [Chitinophaga sp. Hz27]|uniref:hypothetical protein n=1 Tax=Chitinophaga sp. Hz27 TaxID=3347169 RepID=UPI0035DF6205
MNKLKIKLFLAALMVAGAFAFRYSDDQLCSQPIPGYTADPTGQTDPNKYLISGTYGLTYTCVTAPGAVCRWIKNNNGVYVPCSGYFSYL